MPFEPFYERFPELAKAETRSIMVLEQDEGRDTLPSISQELLIRLRCNFSGQ